MCILTIYPNYTCTPQTSSSSNTPCNTHFTPTPFKYSDCVTISILLQDSLSPFTHLYTVKKIKKIKRH